MGRRSSIHFEIRPFGSKVSSCELIALASPLALCSRPSADLDHRVGQELVRRHIHVPRRRAFADPTRFIVVRTVARAEPPVVLALDVANGNKQKAAELLDISSRSMRYRLDKLDVD